VNQAAHTFSLMFPHQSGDTRPGYQLPTGTFLDLSVVQVYTLEGENIFNRASPFYYGTAILRLNGTGLCPVASRRGYRGGIR